jgi:hypothetical protein
MELGEVFWSIVFVCNAYVDIEAAHGGVLECWVGFGVADEIVLWRARRVSAAAERVGSCYSALMRHSPGLTQPSLSLHSRYYVSISKLAIGRTRESMLQSENYNDLTIKS